MQKLEIVNYLKGFSILTIVLMHLIQSYDIPKIIRTASSFGGAGVHVFILCSGFGLFLSQLNKPIPYLNFLKRRFIKVYIPYIIIILLSACTPYYITENTWIEVLSHVFLFKMFIESFENSFGGQMWFVSTIIQFYLLWPLIVKLAQFKWKGVLISLIISLSWAIFITLLDINDQRIWNSFFLQYLWEFVLGMRLAELYYQQPTIIRIPSLKILFSTAIIGMLLTSIAGIKGGWQKVFNDIPSLIGYLSLLLITYKTLPLIWKKFILYTNKISYEWYLSHILIFICCQNIIPIESYWITSLLSFITSYVFANVYSKILKLMHIK